MGIHISRLNKCWTFCQDVLSCLGVGKISVECFVNILRSPWLGYWCKIKFWMHLTPGEHFMQKIKYLFLLPTVTNKKCSLVNYVTTCFSIMEVGNLMYVLEPALEINPRLLSRNLCVRFAKQMIYILSLNFNDILD